MKTFTVMSHKGGSGKTTVAVNLAIAFRSLGFRTVLADADPVRCASESLRKRPEYASLVAETSAAKLAALSWVSARDGCEILIIDTPGGSEDAMIAAMNVTDLCIAVSRPSYLDVAAVLHTIESVRRHRRQGLVLFNQCPPKRNGSQSAVVTRTMDVLRAGGLDVCPVAMQSRAVYQRAIAQGLGVIEHEQGGKAADEVMGLLSYVQERVSRMGGADRAFSPRPHLARFPPIRPDAAPSAHI